MVSRRVTGMRHSSSRTPSPISSAPITVIGEIGAAGPLPPGTEVGNDGCVSGVVEIVVVTSVVAGLVFVLLVDARVVVVLVEVRPDVVVNRVIVLPPVVVSFGGDVDVAVPRPVVVVGPVGAVEVPEDGVVVGVLLLVVVGGAQFGALMTLVSSVTAPVAASNRPVILAPV